MQTKTNTRDPPLSDVNCFIEIDRDEPLVTCSIIESHIRWAQIRCLSPRHVPNYFSLYFSSDRQVARKCRLIFRSNSTLVIKFVD